jgi:lysophospholipase L1-like esterase
LLAIGGSTTACTTLDDAEEWPHLTMKYVNEQLKDDHFLWVTNSGIDGLNTRHHIMHAKYLLPKLPKINYVIIYCGLNDVGSWLYKTDYNPNFLDDPENWDKTVAESFRVCNYARRDDPWYKGMEVYKRASIAKAAVLSRSNEELRKKGVMVEDDRLEWMKQERARREAMLEKTVHRAKRETLPAALDGYARNLKAIIGLVRAAGAEPILMAQTVDWVSDVSEEKKEEKKKRLFWIGAMEEGKAYAKVEEIQAILAQYNDRMKQVAAEAAVPFLDLPALLEGKHELFYDSCHFHEAGSREVARVVSHFLIETFGWTDYRR